MIVSERRKRLSVISEFEKKELTDVFRLTLFYFKFEEKILLLILCFNVQV